MNLSHLVQSIPPSPTLEITAKVNAKKEAGENVISFGAGQPDFDTPDNIKEAAHKAMLDGFTKYTAATGITPLKQAAANQIENSLGLKYETSQLIIGNGAKQVLATAIMACCNPGDEVIIPSPYWVSYPEMAKMAGAKPVFVSLEAPTFDLDINALEKAINPRTRAIIINSPSNPTGRVFSEESLAELAELVIKHQIWAITDEVYDFLVYGENRHHSIATVNPEIKKQTLVVNAVSKKYSMTGWRIGYGAGPKDLIGAMGRIQGHYTSNPNSIAQKGALEALNGDQSSVEIMVKAFTERRNYIVKRLGKMPGIKLEEPQGAFYVFPYIGDIESDDFGFCNDLLEEQGVALVPGSAFGAPGYVRISFATSLEEIAEGMDRMEEFLKDREG